MFAFTFFIYGKRIELDDVRNIPLSAFLCGIFVALECMVKQSTGVLMIVYLIIYFVFCALFVKKKFSFSLIGLLSGIFSIFAILIEYLVLTGSFEAFVKSCLVGAAAAKGGLITELFFWIPSAFSFLWNARAVVLGLIILVEFLIYRQSKNDKSLFMTNQLWLIIGMGVVFTAVVIAFTYIYTLSRAADSWYSNNLCAISFFLCTFAFFAIALFIMSDYFFKTKEVIDKEELLLLFPVLGVVFAQGYGVGMSGGLAASQTALGLGVVVAYLLSIILKDGSYRLVISSVIVTLVLGASFVAQKTFETYNWWGQTTGSFDSNTVYTDVPLLGGIKMRPEDKRCYEIVYADIMKSTEPGDEIFVFPQCPIFYTITDRHSGTYTKVQWFDVSNLANIQHDMDYLSEHKPKAIVFMIMPDNVYTAHENSFKTYQTGAMRDFLMTIIERDYEILSQVDISNGYFVRTYVLKED